MSNEYPVVVTEEFLIALDCFDWDAFNLNLVRRHALLYSPPWTSFRNTRRALEHIFDVKLMASVRP